MSYIKSVILIFLLTISSAAYAAKDSLVDITIPTVGNHIPEKLPSGDILEPQTYNCVWKHPDWFPTLIEL